jgi:hypothetical protein
MLALQLAQAWAAENHGHQASAEAIAAGASVAHELHVVQAAVVLQCILLSLLF